MIIGVLKTIVGLLAIPLQIVAWVVVPSASIYLVLRLRRWVALAATVAVIVVWAQGVLDLAEKQPDASKLDFVKIGRDAQRVVLGRLQLLQNPGVSAADEQHVEFVRDPEQDGGDPAAWSLSNISTRRKLLLAYCGRRNAAASTECRLHHSGEIKLKADRLPVQAGDILELSPASGAKEDLRVRTVATGAGADPPRADGSIRVGLGKPGEADDRFYDLTWSAGRFLLKDAKGAVVPACVEETVALLGFARAARGLARGAADETVLLHVGGGSACVRDEAATIDLRGAQFSSAAIGFVPGVGFVFARDGDAGARVARGGQRMWLGSVPHPLVDTIGGRPVVLDSFVAGRTRYAVEWDDRDNAKFGLRIVPIDRSHRIPRSECPADASVDVVGFHGVRYQTHCGTAANAGDAWKLAAPTPAAAARDAGAFIGGLVRLAWMRGARLFDSVAPRGPIAIAAAVALLAIVGLWRLVRRKPRTVESDGVPEAIIRWALVVTAAVVLLGYLAWKIDPHYLVDETAARMQDVPEAPWRMLIVWALAAVAVATARGSGALDNAIMTVATAIVAFGHCALTSMSLASGELSHLRFADDTTHAIEAAGAAIMLVSQIGPYALATSARWLVLRGPTRPLGLPLPPGLLVVGAGTFVVLLLWFVLGTETGIAELVQPSELVKTLVVILLAASVTLVLDPERDRDARRRARPGAPRREPRRPRLVVCAAAAGAGAALLTIWRVEIGLIAGHQWAIEVMALGFALVALFFLSRLVDEPMWASFLLVAAVVGVIGAVPLFRNDLSAFFVMMTAALATLCVVVAVHWVALWSQRLEFMQPDRSPPPPTSWRLPRGSERTASINGLARRVRAAVWTFVRLQAARPFELAAVAAVAVFALTFHFGATRLVNAGDARGSLVDLMGEGADKPVNRFISWIELNARPDEDGRTISVEFADVALQVLRSRKVIAVARCDDWRRWLPRTSALPVLAAWIPASIAARIESVGADIDSRMAGTVGCGNGATLVDRDPAPPDALSMPEIQNDFIGSWLIVALGRSGALQLVLLQCTLVGLMVFAAFRVVKFQPAHVRNRAAASAAAFATVGFAMMLGVQWAISWANAFGVVPVMGQPATFLSHGPSHLLLFGVPAILAPLCALRLRSALTVLPARDDIEPIPWRFMLRHRIRSATN